MRKENINLSRRVECRLQRRAGPRRIIEHNVSRLSGLMNLVTSTNTPAVSKTFHILFFFAS